MQDGIGTLPKVAGKFLIVGLALVEVLAMAGCSGGSSSTSGNQTATPAFSPGGGTYTASKPVTISDATPGAVLYCTTDGTTPTTSSPQCSQPTTVFKSEFLQAIAVAPNLSPSAVASAGYTIGLPAVATPTFSPAGGTFTSAQTVTIKDTTTGANIYYTTDGSVPITNGVPTASAKLYTGALTVSASETLSAGAVASGYSASGVASANYTISIPNVPTISSLSPASATAGGGAFALTVSGTNFVSGASVLWNGAPLTTTYGSATQLTAAVPASLIASPGSVNVTVVTGSSVSSASTFTIKGAVPTVTGITPTSGTTAGSTSVTITGTNFTGATAVDFGTPAATSFTVNSATSITAISPAGTGTVDVKVVTLGGTSATSAADQFTYIVPVPTVTGITPASGTVAGGTKVTITGTNFITGTTTVDFGTSAGTSITVNSATSITAVSPAGTGTVDVKVITPSGTSATSAADQFTYAVSAPTVSNLTPSSGTVGTKVTITGANFGSTQGTSTVSFNGVKATTINSWSDTSISAVVPATATTGPVVVTVNGVASSSQTFSIGSALTGTVISGTGTSAVAISANVQLYVAGTTGYGQAPSKIGSAVQTDSKGNFSVVYDCSTLTAPGDQLYLVATGTSATNVVLMTALGSCSSVNLLTSVTVNEVTTIAAAYALSAFATIDTANGGIDIGAPGTVTASATTCNAAGNWASSGPNTCNYTGLVNAFKAVNNLVDVSTGQALTHTPAYKLDLAGDPNILNNSQVPTTRINALADMLASCVESSGSSCSGSSGLLTAAKPNGGTQPADTLQAALDIAQNPGNNVSNLLGLVASTPPYSLTSKDTGTLALTAPNAPTDLTLALTFTGAGLGGAPNVTFSDGNNGTVNGALGIDSAGNIWIGASLYSTNNYSKDGQMIAEFNALGAPVTNPTTLNSVTLAPTYGGYNPEPGVNASNSRYITTLAIDQSENLWTDDGLDNVLVTSTTSGPSPSLLTTISPGNYDATDFAIDANGKAWFFISSLTSVESYSANGNSVVIGTTLGTGALNYLAFDSNRGLWASGRNSSRERDVFQISTSDATTIVYDAFPTSTSKHGTTLVAGQGGNIYGCDPTGLSLDQFNANGSAPTTTTLQAIGTGRACGTQLVLDGQGHLFAVDIASVGSIDEFTTVGKGALISPATNGYTGSSSTEAPTLTFDSAYLGAAPAGVGAAIDSSGNLWVLNTDTFGPSTPGNELVEYIGIGAPVVTPASTALGNNMLGVRP